MATMMTMMAMRSGQEQESIELMHSLASRHTFAGHGDIHVQNPYTSKVVSSPMKIKPEKKTERTLPSPVIITNKKTKIKRLI